MKLEISWKIFEKIFNKSHENSPSGSRVILCGRTDSHVEANSRFLHFCERASKFKKVRKNKKGIEKQM
jgi:tRNA U38,U39,U40 pseudouridine synthase TruA